MMDALYQKASLDEGFTPLLIKPMSKALESPFKGAILESVMENVMTPFLGINESLDYSLPKAESSLRSSACQILQLNPA
ncbi:unnamed protein product [Boreogadus saida]